MSDNKLKGKVSWFNEKKGFGVIKCEEKEYFAHHSEIIVDNNIFKALYENEDVLFTPSEKDSKLISVQITGIDGNKLLCESNNKIFKKNNNKNKFNKKPKNTENFKPDHSKSDMCVKFSSTLNKVFEDTFCENDVILVNDFMHQAEKKEMFDKLMTEIQKCSEKNPELWKLWHGDTHFIADDKIEWKQDVPSFQEIIDNIEKFFNFKTISTRFNLYENSDHWKPFHHDAAAIKPHIAEKQNTTIAISFGATRETAFQFNDNKCVVSFPLKDNSVYVFGKDVNINWKHGIPQLPKDKFSDEKRISIILWGWMDQV